MDNFGNSTVNYELGMHVLNNVCRLRVYESRLVEENHKHFCLMTLYKESNQLSAYVIFLTQTSYFSEMSEIFFAISIVKITHNFVFYMDS